MRTCVVLLGVITITNIRLGKMYVRNWINWKHKIQLIER